MKVVERIPELRALLGGHRDRRIGFVPTMGFLHDGHISLVRRAREVSDLVVTSIYVNPTQFAPGEDLATYPRDPDGDRRKLEAAGCDVLYLPSTGDLYPERFSTFVTVGDITTRYEGAVRPEHFRGVTTVVAKLFNIVGPDVAVFGQKDAQQVAVVRRMIADLDFPIELLVGPTVRDADGLAMSSRNVYLSPDDRREALSISRALRAARGALDAGAGLPEAEAAMRGTLSPALAVDYADIVDADTFEPVSSPGAAPLAVIAARIGRTRLIDNMPLGA